MTPTQAKIEAFEEAKRIVERAAAETAPASWVYGPEHRRLHEHAIEDLSLEIAKLRKARPQAAPSTPKDDYRDFSGFGT